MLAAAADERLPLLERVKLCAIVSSNLDEFFAVRIAGLRSRVADGVRRRSLDGRSPAKTLAAARTKALALRAEQDELWLDDLRPALAAEGIRVAAVEQLRRRELRALAKYFRREVQPLLTPIAVGVAAPFPYLPSLALNLGVVVRDNDTRERRFVRVNVPADLPRFADLGHGYLVALEDVIRHFLPTVLGVGALDACTTFRITRDADLSVEQDVDDLLLEVERQLLLRRFGEVVRLELDRGTPRLLQVLLERELGVDDDQIYERQAPLGLGSLIELYELDRPELKYAPWRPVTRRPFAKRSASEILTQIRRRDILVQHPYDAFESTVEAFAAAARDPKVTALKATVYRTGDPSTTLDSLVHAAEDEKQAVCLVELKARFDERRNIQWSRALELAGVDVVYGAADLKVHAKLVLLVRRERNGLRRYVHIGTGNYHASNASTFEDLSMFTADPEIAADVADVFNAVTGRSRPAVFRKLLVGPWFLREGILAEIARVAEACRAGGPGRIRIKVNSLVDSEIVEALYAASEAGATVQIVTRGICVLRPGVPGLSERIAVRSVLGRFLEHSRFLSFETGDRVTTWMGSADLMPRNLDRRIEVLAPVEDARLRTELSHIFDALLADTHLSWELDADGVWNRTRPARGSRAVSAQELLMARATKRAKKSRSRA